MSVTAPPDKGRANKAIIRSLAKALQLKASQIELISGQTSRRKVFAVAGAGPGFEEKVQELMQAE